MIAVVRLRQIMCVTFFLCDGRPAYGRGKGAFAIPVRIAQHFGDFYQLVGVLGSKPERVMEKIYQQPHRRSVPIDPAAMWDEEPALENGHRNGHSVIAFE
jgi:hypothetical protein